MKTTIAITIITLAACGCSNLERAISPQGMTLKEMNAISKPSYVIHDTVYDDYYDGKEWGERKDAKLYTYDNAVVFLLDFKTHERGEYADTGKDPYPIKIEKR